ALILREEGSGTRQVLEAALGGLARPLIELSSTTAVKAAAVSGAGPAVLSELAVGDELALRRLIRVPVNGIALARDLRAVWPTGHRPTGPARDLLSLTRACGARPGRWRGRGPGARSRTAPGPASGCRDGRADPWSVAGGGRGRCGGWAVRCLRAGVVRRRGRLVRWRVTGSAACVRIGWLAGHRPHRRPATCCPSGAVAQGLRPGCVVADGASTGGPGPGPFPGCRDGPADPWSVGGGGRGGRGGCADRCVAAGVERP